MIESYDVCSRLELYKELRVISKYSIPLSEYRRVVSIANNHCMMCGVGPGILQIDHNHETGKLRGLLCGSCNSFLGHLESTGNSVDIERLNEAMLYLNRCG